MGFWHRGSAGIGVAPLDVCKSPPPGPVPIPYTNFLKAADLIKGSKTVFIDGEPTALEDYSETSTSTGDEGGTLGGSVITGVIKGKGFFMVWSMTVYIEGKGVARHGDIMGQNSASAPPSTQNAGAVNQANNPTAPEPAPVAAQRAARTNVLEATGPGDSEAKELIPCDFERVKISCGHEDGKRKGKFMEFWYSGQIEDNLKKGTAQNPITTNIQLVAGVMGKGADKLKVELVGGPGYNCSKNHPLIVLTDRSDPSAKPVRKQGEPAVTFEVNSKFVEPPPALWMSLLAVIHYYWFSPKTTRSYFLEIESCGVLADLSYGFRKLSRTVEVFSSDICKLGFELPAAIKREKQDGMMLKSPLLHDWEDKETDWDKGEGLASAGKSFTFEKNGEDFSSKLKIGEIVAALIAVRKGIAAVMDTIDGLQAGVKPVCEVEFFSGALSVEWGCKEWSDQRVYRYWKVESSLTLLKATIGVAAGIKFFEDSWYAVVGVLEGTVTGEIKFAFSMESNPDEAEPPAVTTSGECTGQIKATGQLGNRWLFVEGLIKASISAEGAFKIQFKEPFTLDYKVAWSGIKFEGQVYSKIWGSVGVDHTLVKGKTLSEGTLFDPKAPAPAEKAPPKRSRRRRRRRN
ncbi:hypothetical protein PPSIR1_13705 [Plesiocystis pacifica SIR-1]|uniref:Uncharacterized protein n=2 Tax=Plesiocystis pacifica TaxID=191768 RepID=A6GJJ9_9BACT|nr:hypothetical protein PPSIR1_13705 [Plesiocystis pacifica SIR-1]